LLKIFVADDDKIIRDGLKLIIEESNQEYKVVGEASNGVQALEAIESLKPDVLIADINMPEMDGVELIKKLRSSQNAISIIVLSGFDEYRYVRESMKQGALDYLLKPVNNESLIELLDRISNELSLVKENKEKALVQSVRLEESMSLLKGKLINELVKGNGMNNPKIEELLLDFGIASTENIILSIIRTDNVCKMEKDRIRGITFSPGNIIESYILNNFGSGSDKQIISTSTDYEVILLAYANDNSFDLEEYIYEQLESIRCEIEKKENFTICAGISHIFNNIRKLHIPYNQALFSLKRRFYEGGNKVIKYLQESSCYIYINENIISNYFDKIINSMEITDTVKIGKIIEEMLISFHKSNGDPEQIRKICIELVQKICIRLNEFQSAMELFPGEDLDMILMQ
jgi:two-component system, response regulator YesN